MRLDYIGILAVYFILVAPLNGYPKTSHKGIWVLLSNIT